MGTFGLILGLALCVCGAWSIEEQTDNTGPGSVRARHWKQRLIGARDFSDKEKADLVGKHNDIRSEVGAAYMKYMEWDESLASKAKNIAKECKFGNKNAIDAANVYAGPEKDPSSVMNAWIKKDRNKCEQPEDDCTYQQMTVPDSAKVGCAWKYCSSVNKTNPEYLVVCQYDVKFDKEAHAIRTGTPCSKCGDEEPKCYQSLCMSRNLCADAKFRDDCECKLECGEGFALNKEACDCEDLGESNEQALEDANMYKQSLDLLRLQGATATTMGPGPGTTLMAVVPTGHTVVKPAVTAAVAPTEISPEESVEGDGDRIIPTVSCILVGLSAWLLNNCK